MNKQQWLALATATLFVLKKLAKPALILLLFPVVVVLGLHTFGRPRLLLHSSDILVLAYG